MEKKEITYRGGHFVSEIWNGISIRKHVETGYYQASKACKDNGKNFADWFRLKSTKEYLKAASEEFELTVENDVSLEAGVPASVDSLLFRVNISGNDLKEFGSIQGYYIHPELFHDVCYWADKPRALKVSRLMNQINEEAKLKQQTFDEILAQKEREIEELKEKYRVSNTPINRGIQTGSLYAQPVSSTSFHLRWSKEPILESRIPNLKHVEVYNGDDIRKMVIRQLKLEKKIKSENFGSKAKLVVKNEDLEYVFDLINKASKAETSEISAEKRDKYLNNKLAEYKNRRQTSMMKGFIFETETVLKRKDYIPWALLPDEIIGNYGEQRRDCGIDAVVLNPDNSFKEIIQIKHHLNTYIRENEIEAFIKKTTQSRYDGCAKRLILHGCKYGKKLEKYITDRGIVIENI